MNKTHVLSPVRDLREYDFFFLFRYQIFPPQILSFFGEWQLYNRNMEVGDIIIQQAMIPPLPLSIKLLFGDRRALEMMKENFLSLLSN